MTGALVLVAAWLVAFIIFRISGLIPAFTHMGRAWRRSLRIVSRRRVSEWAKERAVQLSSLRLIGASVGLLLRVALVAAPFALAFLLDWWRPFGLRHAFLDWRVRLGLLVLLAAILLGRRARGWFRDSAEKALMRIGLSRMTLEITFDLERSTFGRKAGSPTEEPVFVAGLARAGTTIITRTLVELGCYATNRYRDLPFPLAPNLWARLGGAKRQVAAVERGHGDGMLHDLDSPEAIEEVFWLLKEGDRYRSAAGLRPVQSSEEALRDFRSFVALTMLRDQKRRYLSKNNNNILRLGSLVKAFPHAVFIHPFRSPLQQAASLRGQHLRACELAADPERVAFMTALGHHEFGADHRPFLLNGATPNRYEPGTLSYWLHVWVEVYGYLLEQPEAVRARQVFIDYDDLTRGNLEPIFAAVGQSPPISLAESIRDPRTHSEDDHDLGLAREAAVIHRKLRERASASRESHIADTA